MMRLTHVQIKNFRSIEDTDRFRIGDLTCLVGKNEAGKTAVLQAIQGLKPYGHRQTKFDVMKEYPRRHVTRFDQRHPNGTAEVVRTWWELESKDIKAIENGVGAGAVSSTNMEIFRSYKDDATRYIVPIDQKQAIKGLIDAGGLTPLESEPFDGVESGSKLMKVLEGMGEKSTRQATLQARIQGFRDSSIQLQAIDNVSDGVPRFFYTSHYNRMSGEISINKIIADKAGDSVTIGDQIFLDFLELAGTSLEELRSATHYEDLKARLEAASNEITDQIFKYWSQNDSLEVQLEFSEGKPEDAPPFNSGTVIRARVWNALHRASVPFSERSAGFVWFFSFLVQFAAMRKGAGNVIILLDEPGLTLHGKAQADLLQYIKSELLPYHQVIFSTHSPFMVPTDQFESIRVVEDVIDRTRPGRPSIIGTKVRDDVLVTNPDTLFPLQAALGYDISQSLFVGKNTLLVEGPSDILYLQAFSNALKKRGEVGLDSRWTMCPAGGIDKIRSFVSLFGGNHLNVAVLTDMAVGDKKKVEALRKNEILHSGRVYTMSDFVENDEADVEDFFDTATFSNLLNSSYDLVGKVQMTAARLTSAAPETTRVVKMAEAAFNTLPEPYPVFDHFAPASWLIRNPQFLEGDEPAIGNTLRKAEACFKVFNGLLDSAA